MLAPTMVTAITRAEIDSSIATAKAYPRTISRCMADAKTLATASVEVAESCMYTLSRNEADGGKKMITGGSIRLAEIMSYTWGNLRAGARIIAIDAEHVTAQGVCHDLEKNVSHTTEVKRRITTRNGKRYGADMIQVTCNAACSIAKRNAILGVVPRSYWEQVYDAAKAVAVGTAQTLAEKRARMKDALGKMGVTPAMILKKLGKTKPEDIDLADIETLIGLHTAIKDGTPADEVFAEERQPQSGSGNDTVKDRLGIADRPGGELGGVYRTKEESDRLRAQPPPLAQVLLDAATDVPPVRKAPRNRAVTPKPPTRIEDEVEPTPAANESAGVELLTDEELRDDVGKALIRLPKLAYETIMRNYGFGSAAEAKGKADRRTLERMLADAENELQGATHGS